MWGKIKMNKKFKRLITLLMFFMLFLPIKAKAICNYTELANLKKLASNVNISYDYEDISNSVKFNVTISNITKNVSVKDVTNNRTFSTINTTDGEVVISDFRDGQTYKMEVYSNSISSCYGELLNTVYVNLPSYNPYYGNKICNGIEDYSLCQKWIKHSMTWNEYEKAINEYKESLSIKKQEELIHRTFIEKIIDFVYNNYIYVSSCIVILIIVIIIIRYITRDRFKYLK